MNENIDLTKILKDCPEGTKLWSDNYGMVYFMCIDKSFDESVLTKRPDGYIAAYTKQGWCTVDFPANCLLWPSENCRDWSKFTAPWYKKGKFGPKTFKPFDKIIACIDEQGLWCCDLFSFIEEDTNLIKGSGAYYKYCIPYNDETKHLIGTTKEAPEYYRYWEE